MCLWDEDTFWPSDPLAALGLQELAPLPVRLIGFRKLDENKCELGLCHETEGLGKRGHRYKSSEYPVKVDITGAMAMGSQCALEDAQDKLYVSLNARLAL